jgi:ATP-dependent DNA helicase RecG
VTTRGILDTRLSGILGGKTADALRTGLGLDTVEDLLRHYPRRYAERGELTDLALLDEGEQVTVLAEVQSVTVRPMRNRRGSILEAVISDGQQSMSLTFFNQKWRERQLRAGRRGLFAGQVGRYRGTLQLAHPEFHLFAEGVQEDEEAMVTFAGALIPIYGAARGVTSWQVHTAVDVVLRSTTSMTPFPNSSDSNVTWCHSARPCVSSIGRPRARTSTRPSRACDLRRRTSSRCCLRSGGP